LRHIASTAAPAALVTLLAATLVLPFTTTTGQVRLPSQPLAITPSSPAPAEPLQILEAPSGNLLVPVFFGWSERSSLAPRVRTKGDKGTVTQTLEVTARPVQAFRFVDPPANTDPRFQLAAPQ
jgi:hypothetical protein